MFDLSKHPFFSEYIDKKSGVKSYILTKRVAQMQKHFYFAQPSLTKNGKYLWFVCCNPPARYSTLAVVSLDPKDPFIRHFPHAAPDMQGSLPCLDPKGDGVYFGSYDTVYKLSIDGELNPVIHLSQEFVHNRPINRLFTHASISCDNKYIALDMQIGGIWYLALGDIESGEVKLLNKFGRCYNHAMFSPKDPDLLLIDQDWWRDSHTGEYMPINNRIWLADTEGTSFEPLFPKEFYGRRETEGAHDYFSGDGYIMWSDYYNGAFECNLDSRDVNHVWKRPICHSHCSSDRKLFVGDQSPYGWINTPCRTIFYDRESNKEIDIFSALPYPGYDRFYHVDPHPQFCANDTCIVSTSTVMDGRVDVALTPVEPLKKQCRREGETVVWGGYKPHARGSWVDDTMKMMI